MIHKNPETEFAEKEYLPDMDASAFIHPLAAVIGNIVIGKKVMDGLTFCFCAWR